MQFRRATTSDLEAVIAWVPDAEACLVWAGPKVTFPIKLDQLLQAIAFDTTHTYALSGQGELLAVGQIRFFDSDASHRRGHLSRIIVHPAFRRQGMGQRFVRGLISEAQRLKCQPITLHVVDGNTAAIRLYEKLGFIAPAKQPVNLRSGIIHMELTRVS